MTVDNEALFQRYREQLRAVWHVSAILDAEENVFRKVEELGRPDLLRQSAMTLEAALLNYRHALHDLIDSLRGET